jgi:hypothetical protein
MHYKANHDGAHKHKCKECNYETSTKQALDNHIQAKHPEKAETAPKQFQCPSCTFSCIRKAGLRSHYLLKHLTKEVNEFLGKTEEGGIMCTSCGVEFASKPAYIYHIVGCLPESVKTDAAKKALAIS